MLALFPGLKSWAMICVAGDPASILLVSRSAATEIFAPGFSPGNQ